MVNCRGKSVLALGGVPWRGVACGGGEALGRVTRTGQAVQMRVARDEQTEGGAVLCMQVESW
jgi:hypothetical protein